MQGVGGVPPPVQHSMLHDVTLTASQKCLCEHTFLLRGIISAGRIAMQFFTADASTHQRCVCGIDGLVKMLLQASIFTSWLNCLRRMLLCSLRGLCPQPCLRHGLGIDGLAKMFVRAHIFASWYNGHMILAMRQVSAAAPTVRQRAARCAIDGLAKMPLRASIFASWYNAWDFA